MTADSQASVVLAATIAAAGVFGVAATMRGAPAGPARRRAIAAVAIGNAAGVVAALAGHALVFWIASAAASLSVGPLIRRGAGAQDDPSDAETRRARRAYVWCAATGDALLAAGLIVAIRAAGTADLALLPARAVMDRSILVAATLILLGGGLKTGAAPLHVWLPAAVRAASTPATILIVGVTSRVGLLALIRLLPLGFVALDRWGVPVALLGVLGAFYGAAACVRERDARAALAYLCVSQAGLALVGIGLGLVTAAGWPALRPAVLATSAHGGLAFVALGLALDAALTPGSSHVVRTATLTIVVVVGLSLAGAPLTGGAAVMALLIGAIGDTGLPAARGFVSLLQLAAAATTVATARLLCLAVRRSREADPASAPHRVPPARGSAAIGLAASAGLTAVCSPILLSVGPAELAPVSVGLFAWTGVLTHIAGGAAIAGLAWTVGPRLAWRR